ncbi:ABC transporter substrate-binding protein [Rhodococcus sp. C3V]|uniref:ABC transporter substrate-binding protein n=1 Tax=Rhodococcus sp. C3V TaxID=3034165 RepID=UPI0023E11BFD|nr:ABC transporter substrate-binding protein [Rhodococcus sp. C3V]MDF3319984.1 ABC transporter substrate-binding protein [Rhodococcus sp. C3V]
MKIVSRARKSIMYGAAALLMCASMTACAGSGSGGSDGTNELKVGVLRGTILLLPTTVADKQGFFKDAGLDVELIDQPFASLIPALLGGSVDITAADAALPLSAIKEGQDLTVLPSVTKYDGNIVVAPNSGLKQVADLKGKTIGYVGGQSRYFVEDTLKNAGVSLDDVQLISTGDQASTLAASVSNGRVDAVMMATGSLELFRSEGGELNVIASSVDGTAGPYGDVGINAWFTTTTNYADKNPDTLNKFCTAMLNSTKFIVDENNRDAVIDDIMAHIGTQDRDAAVTIYDKLRPLWADQVVDEARWNANAEALLQGDTVPYSHWAANCGG